MTALITGASSGIGRDMARYLASMGYDLILVARRDDRLNELKNEFSGVSVRCIQADLSSSDECRRVYEETKKDNVDILINNAGFGMAGEFVRGDLDRELEMIDVNIRAVHILTKLFLKDFVKRDSGLILNVASSAGFMAGPLMSEYYASKNYVLRLSEGIAEELRRNKSSVKISALCPGPVNTEFNRVADVRFALKGISSRYCAKYAIDKALKGKLIIVPGAMMKAGLFFIRFLPEKLAIRAAYHFQQRKLYDKKES